MLYISSIEANSLSISNTSSKVYKFTPEDSEQTKVRGPLFVIVGISMNNEAESLTSALLQTLQTNYYQAQGDSFNALRKAVEKVEQEFAGKAGELNLAATSFIDGVIYSAVLGFAEVSIIRKGMVANILSGKGPIIVASGYPQEEDLLVLATLDFFNKVPSNELKQLLETQDLEEVQARLKGELTSREDSGKNAVLVLKFGSEVPPKKESLIINEENLQKRSIFPGVLSTISNTLANLIPKRKIFVRNELQYQPDDSKKKTTITVGVILLTLLLVSVIFGIRQRSMKLSKSKYEARLTQAMHDFDEASSLLSLDSSRARELFLASQKVANDLKKEGVKDVQLDELVKKIETGQAAILKEFRQDPSDFVDLDLLSSGFKGTDLASSGEDVFVLDTGTRKVVRVSIENKKAEVASGPENVGAASQIAAYEDRSFVLTDEGIRELGRKNQLVIPKDWEGPILIYSYAGNLYVLDKGLSAISRLPGVEAGFASKQNWLGAGITPDFSGVVSWTIDGTVWVLNNSGKISKFTLGSSQAFGITGMGQPLNNPTNIYTNENLQNLYILDAANSRVVVVDKTGVYKAQYVSDQFKSATDLVVSEKDKRAVVLISGNLKSIDLKHL